MADNEKENLEQFDDYLVKKKEKRRSKRRSSVSSKEAIELMKLANEQNDLDNETILAKIVDYQYNFIKTQYDKFKDHEKLAKNLAQRSIVSLKLSQNKDENNLSIQEKYDRDYALLDDKQKKFLKDSEIGPEIFLDAIKRRRLMNMQALCNSINDTSKDNYSNNTFLTKKHSRLSYSTNIIKQSKSKRGVPEILQEYFES